MPLPQASSSSEEKKKKEEKKSPSLKIKFTLSTFSRIIDDDEVVHDENENNDDDDDVQPEDTTSSSSPESKNIASGGTTATNNNKSNADENSSEDTESDTFEGSTATPPIVIMKRKKEDGLVLKKKKKKKMETATISSNIANVKEEDVIKAEENDDEEEEAEEGEIDSIESSSVAMNTGGGDVDGDAGEKSAANNNSSFDDSNEKMEIEKDSAEEDVNASADVDNDADMSLAEEDKGSQSQEDGEERDSQCDEEEDKDATNISSSTNEVSNRPARTRSSYDNKDLGNDQLDKEKEKDKLSNNDDSRGGKDDASLNTNNGTSNNNNATYTTTTSRSALSTERDILGFREPPSSTSNLTMSFLDSLSEEQRRVRTRHLPNVTGFRRLHKSEIKRDIAHIKIMLKTAVSKGKEGKNGSSVVTADDEGSNNETQSMDIDGSTNANNTQASGDETPSEEEGPTSATLGGKENTLNDTSANVYDVFSLPYIQSPYICTDVDTKHSIQNSDEPALFSSPQVVESITAFNPPRPPESVGPKKMHRLHRWERNPQDVEVDLSCYRKTVNRTRQELHKAEIERERIEVAGAHLRSHFLTELKCMRHEMRLLNQQYDATQIKCVKGADLLTSKTRSRGVGRSSYVMKDVISVLKSRGEKLNLNSHKTTLFKSGESWCTTGVGGVSYRDDASEKLGSGWLLPGDKVSTPCGIGIIEKVYGPTIVEGNDKAYNSSENKLSHSQTSKKQETIEEGTVKSSLSARLSVKLPFGTGYFNPADLTLIENSSSFGDKKLCTRWMAMLETAKKMGTVADSKSVDNHNAIQLPIAQSKGDKNDDADDDDLTESSILPDAANTEMDIDDLSTVPNAATLTKNNKMVSFNAGILPLGNNTVPNIDLPQMENAVQKLLKGSGGVVGARNYPSVPSGYRKWESNREELRILEGEAIQLRNKVYRQKRIRFLNERSCNSNKDRSDRFESLLTEMKADLSILKKRLNDELIELGIDQSKAEELLAENYSQESKDDDYKVASHGEKRKRKG